MKVLFVSLIAVFLFGCASFFTDSHVVSELGGVDSSPAVVAQNTSSVIGEPEVDFFEITIPSEVNDMVLDSILTVPSQREYFPLGLIFLYSG